MYGIFAYLFTIKYQLSRLHGSYGHLSNIYVFPTCITGFLGPTGPPCWNEAVHVFVGHQGALGTSSSFLSGGETPSSAN